MPPPDRDLAAPVLAVAHRAGNSARALRAAAALGAHLAEADIHLHRGRLEVRHGRPLGPLPLRLLLDGWRLRRDRRFTLADLLDAAPDPGPVLMLDLKAGARAIGARAIGEQVREVLLRHPTGRRVVACAARWETLAPLAELDRVLPALSAGSADQLGRVVDQLRPDRRVHLVSVDHRLLTPDVAARLHERVPVLLAWTVNRPADLPRLLALAATGTVGVISDSPAVLTRVLAEAAR